MSEVLLSSYNIRYSVELAEPNAHRFHVHLEIDHPETEQIIRLPNWIPGSYLVRDFVKNIVELEAYSIESGMKLLTTKLDKSSWKIITHGKPVRISYIVYAWDLSVRSAHFDQTHAYFNGTSLFLEVLEHEKEPCLLTIEKPTSEPYDTWQVATSLRPVDHPRYEFGHYHAENYDDLIDHPVEISDFTLASFEACGVQHDVVLVGKHYADTDKLCQDLKQICEYQINFFETPPPVDYYLFMTLVVEQGYGGLEHRASTSLISERSDLPAKNATEITEGYRTYLSLCCHEYFHTWNVKRIKPAKFLPYDLTQEVHTELMWLFEGVTSYFDNLLLARSGVITEESYLELLGQDITRVHRQNGRFRQTVAESSFDTWTRFYQQDEGAPNHIVSYYAKGALIALGLDLLILKESQQQARLDDVMRHLWKRYLATGFGVSETEMPGLIKQVTGVDVSEYLQQALHTTDDLPLKDILADHGVELIWYPAASLTDTGGKKPSTESTHSLGVRAKAHPMGAELVHVLDNMPGQIAGLSTGDVILAIDQLKLGKQDMDKVISNFSVGDEIECHFFRRDQLMVTTIKLTESTLSSCYLTISDTNKCREWIKR
ncbi:PDZ domain-containing protein [Litoribacillus peritrichatus]|uniref:PDZ domain-containing protein n=1 Tax=Litoribacillus peritrichatus TaxID=718191 RepID=A0ABP7MGE6_9GAMM